VLETDKGATGLLKRLLGLEEAEMKVSLAAVLFPEAARLWLDSRTPYISSRTAKDYQYYIARLAKFFGELKISEIDAEQVRAYQKARSATAGPQAVNHEVSILVQMKKRLGQWAEMAADYQPLSVPRRGPGKALTPAEEERLWRVAQSNPAWRVAFRSAQLMANTTMGPGEVRFLRLKDVELERRTVSIVEHTKNQYRVRVIPLNELALEALEELLVRAKKLGASQPDHYLLPYRVRTGHYDPTQPASECFIRTSFVAMRYAADLPSLRIYDMRHHALTKLCESPEVSEETIRSIAGHVSREMMNWYSHVRIEARREAVSALDYRKKKPGPVGKRWEKRDSGKPLKIWQI